MKAGRRIVLWNQYSERSFIMALLIKNGLLVTMNPQREIGQADIYIKKDRIINIAAHIDSTDAQVIDATGKLVIPGLIQTHVHLCQALFRGMADDMELLDWLKKRIWPLEGAHDKDSLYYSALLGCAELLRGGTTGIIDMGTVRHTEMIFQAALQAGLRYLGGKCLMDCGEELPETLRDDPQAAIDESMALYQRFNGLYDNRIRYCFCPRFAVSCSDRLLQQVARIAAASNIPVHTHASESRAEVLLVERERGLPNVLYLDKLGLCSPNLILAHCIHLLDSEKDLLAQSGTHIAHCPGSNLKLASGIAPIPDLLARGAKVSLGADGAPCNNLLSMFNEMHLAALIQKPQHGPTAMPAETVFAMATLGGARAMGMADQIGSLEVGKKADLAIVSLDGWHHYPPRGAGVYAHLVYQALATDVCATIVDGRVLMEQGQLHTIPEAEVKANASLALARVRQRCGL
jgi:5-methylthioadenosine/S-adenosylhomocysteine deaminase